MKRKIDWLQFGQYMAMINVLWTMIKEEFTRKKIGPEILDWLNGPGKQFFQNKCLPTLSEEYLRFLERERRESPSTPPNRKDPYTILRATVDLSVTPKLPFEEAKIAKDTPGNPKAVIELGSDDKLRIDDKEIILHLEPGQKGGVMKGTILREALSGKSVQNAALLDFLHANTHFIPSHWKVDENGKARYIFFWGTEFSDSDGGLCVRYLYWNGARWDGHCPWLGGDWSGLSPAAVSAS